MFEEKKENQEDIFRRKYCEGKNVTVKFSSFMQPEQDSSIIKPKFIKKVDKRKFIACFVISSREKFEARQVIRDTWGSMIKPLFIIGRNPNSEWNDPSSDDDTLKDEADQFDDIFMENFIDTYDNLTIKTGFAMKNFLHYYKNSTYFMKIDDDVLLNVVKLFELVEKAPENSLIGQLTENAIPKRDISSKWFVPKCMYDKQFYPSYLQGPVYIIPGHLIEPIFFEAQQMNFLYYFKFEDIFWTGFIAGQKLNIKLHDDKSFSLFQSAKTLETNPCLINDFVALHKASADAMIKGWQAFVTQKKC